MALLAFIWQFFMNDEQLIIEQRRGTIIWEWFIFTQHYSNLIHPMMVWSTFQTLLPSFMVTCRRIFLERNCDISYVLYTCCDEKRSALMLLFNMCDSDGSVNSEFYEFWSCNVCLDKWGLTVKLYGNWLFLVTLVLILPLVIIVSF